MWAGEARVRHRFKWMTVSTDKQVLRCFALPARRCGGFRTICASLFGSGVACRSPKAPGVDSVRAAKTHATRIPVACFDHIRQLERIGCILGANMMCDGVLMRFVTPSTPRAGGGQEGRSGTRLHVSLSLGIRGQL
jgi:hypothetical protein